MVTKITLYALLLTDDVSKVVTEKLPFNDTSKYTIIGVQLFNLCYPSPLCRPLFMFGYFDV